ncbi:Major Facilitator Superfamily (MFS) [Achlya hypogyna]|uniref:Major Facilitator Superfamily (MFS) n=1 Tax=Achlya hypogyna TaxID=1202772 RepID=A0A1V9Y566_ACHHY|nr:Major Facilitator Superfamily (MFS) [Achlya hypogyna]
MSIEIIVSSLIAASVVSGALLDAEGSRESRRLLSRSCRWRRLGNWMPLGIAYAAFYMARYNIAAGNVDSIRLQLGMTATDMGWYDFCASVLVLVDTRVISSGSWAYALSAPFTGNLTDRIGGRRGIVLACVGAGLCNLVMGLAFSFGTFSQSEFMFFFALNQAFQGFGTAGVVKVNAMWYAPSERGLFSGIFNMLVVSGYYLALGSGDSIVAALGWPYLFYIPSLMLFAMSLLVLLWVQNAPVSLHPSPPASVVVHESNAPSALGRLLRNKSVWGYLGAIFWLSWSRDGLLNWMYSYFDAVRTIPLTAGDHALLGGAWTLGGFVGGVLCGWISDAIFLGQRMPPIVLFSVMQGIVVSAMYFWAPSVSVPVLALLLWIASVFLLGSYTLLSYTIPTDLPVEIAASAGGLFTTAAYVATGLSGAAMGAIVQRWGYAVWVTSLVLASLASGVCTFAGTHLAARDAIFESEMVPLQGGAKDFTSASASRSRRASLVNTQSDFFAVAIDDDDAAMDENGAMPYATSKLRQAS